MTEQQSCTLCESQQTKGFFEDKVRKYFRCQICNLIFVPAEFHLSTADEKSVYDLHENSPSDKGYRRFLSRLFEPVNEIVSEEFEKPSRGLDFGSGPGPTLSLMFEEAGHSMQIYDPLYANNESVLNQQYDFVTATEVIEHFRQPRKDLQKIWALIKPGGVLGLMTKLTLDQDSFSRWHYKNDPTHVAFYSRETFAWLARFWKSEQRIIGSDVILIRRPLQKDRVKQSPDPPYN